jgi:hypothetical protein
MVALSLRGLAASSALRGELEAAARIEAAAGAIDDQTGYRLEPYERIAFGEAMKHVVERADDAEIAAARTAGSAMTESTAAAYALAVAAEHAGPERSAYGQAS